MSIPYATASVTIEDGTTEVHGVVAGGVYVEYGCLRLIYSQGCSMDVEDGCIYAPGAWRRVVVTVNKALPD